MCRLPGSDSHPSRGHRRCLKGVFSLPGSVAVSLLSSLSNLSSSSLSLTLNTTFTKHILWSETPTTSNMKLSAITFLALAAGAIAAPAPAPEAEVAPQEEKREASPGYASYGDYKGAGENLPSYPSYGTYGAKPKPKPKPKPAPKKPAPKKYTNYGSYNYKKYGSYGSYKREEVEKREAEPEVEVEVEKREAEPEAEVEVDVEKREASPGYASYGDYKGAGENLPSYPSYGTYGAKPKPKPKPKPAPKKYTTYGSYSYKKYGSYGAYKRTTDWIKSWF
ncbi:hypothetical protein NCS57_00017700 [Fusarium keratoplasticum]|uniref:Uncharacterized protein n=1 Tax=Fusarium keratoplasticum TaxID=1328300 RepID=A0ACC0RCL5_9HYPO|nr:hypothetical protein NCS57_00017700 [Fusarium keratoplasticum]KAI8683532.1 hypothetical protein NCS57_00017700 [Fusarium keratoplasticum]KAI8687653.1 hypothetical protein NCS55_00017200 [Fusarium keratoplasticum]